MGKLSETLNARHELVMLFVRPTRDLPPQLAVSYPSRESLWRAPWKSTLTDEALHKILEEDFASMIVCVYQTLIFFRSPYFAT